MANTALVGVIAEIVPNGEVQHVSGVTPIGKDLEYYRNVPITPMAYGQALAMAALIEWERLFILDDTVTLGPHITNIALLTRNTFIKQTASTHARRNRRHGRRSGQRSNANQEVSNTSLARVDRPRR